MFSSNLAGATDDAAWFPFGEPIVRWAGLGLDKARLIEGREKFAVEFSALPACPSRSGSVHPPLPRRDTDQKLRERRLNTLFKALLLVLVCGCLCYLRWTLPATETQRAPQKPEFGMAMENYDKVREGMSITEVEALLGPPTGDPNQNPGLEDLSFSVYRGGMTNWRKWQPDEGGNTWIAIYFHSDRVGIKLKRGF